MNHQTILYVEDQENDVIFMRHAWTKAGLLNPLHVVTDGEQALEYLAGEGKYANRVEHPCPGLVLLDLMLPKLHGLDVLKWIRLQSSTLLLPVIVFSSSSKPQDVCRAYELHVNAYLTKPARLEELVQMIASLKDFWLRCVEPPPDCAEVRAGLARGLEAK